MSAETARPHAGAGVPPIREIQTDVVVVGGGGSGLAAAVSAAEHGRRVILLEKNAELGGTTRWSVGSITASGTSHQRDRGIRDSPEAHFEDLGRLVGPLANRDNLALRRLLVENVTETFGWLRGFGVEFFGPFEETPHRVARMHNVLPNSRAYIYHLGRAARRKDVDIRLGARATRILLDGGTARGIEAETRHGTLRVMARNGVVMAGGDYAGNGEMKAALASPDLANVPAVNATATGDGQRMIEAVGGEIVNGDLVLGPVLRFATPPRRPLYERIPPHAGLTRFMRWALDRLPPSIIRPFVMGFMTTVLAPERSLFENGAILVGSDGRAVDLAGGTPGQALARTGDNTGYIVFDERLARAYAGWPHFVSTAPGVAYAYLPDYRRTRPDLCHDGHTLATLAAALAMQEGALDAVVGRTLTTPPFHALGPLRAVMVYTDGGVRVSERLEVLRTDGLPIPGLYAGGSNGQGGVLLEGHGHHLGWAFTSGRLAGAHAAAFEGAAH